MVTVVTGGAGFVGCNLAAALARQGRPVVVADNLSRPGSVRNLMALLERPELGGRVTFSHLDVRDPRACADLLAQHDVDGVVHLAAQVAVTHSLDDVRGDWEINAGGTINMLEALRLHQPDAPFVFTSTNKVYGSLEGLAVQRNGTRWELPDYPDGIDESFTTDAATPYGCSKLAADSYVRDYGRTFNLRTTVLRMSCVYGRWQNGNADQGWVNGLARAALRGEKVVVYGDGLQVRDLLHVDDLVTVLIRLLDGAGGNGAVFNVGGGPRFSVSVWGEFADLLAAAVGHKPAVTHAEPRINDQKVYISDTSRLSRELDWTPRIAPAEGVADMVDWLRRTSEAAR